MVGMSMPGIHVTTTCFRSVASTCAMRTRTSSWRVITPTTRHHAHRCNSDLDRNAIYRVECSRCSTIMQQCTQHLMSHRRAPDLRLREHEREQLSLRMQLRRQPMIPSPLQSAIFAHVADTTRKHLVIEALAGTGKTTTIVQAMQHTPEHQSVLMVAFNKSIATELARRVPEGVEVSTLHSYGLRACQSALGGVEVESGRVAAMARAVVGDAPWDREMRTATTKLVSAAKAYATTFESCSPEALDALIDTREIDIPGQATITAKFPGRCSVCRGDVTAGSRVVFDRPHVMHPGCADANSSNRRAMIGHALRILSRCFRADDHEIDYDDMIWLPVVRDLHLPTFDWVFVDETQDLNPVQIALVLRACKPSGRVVAVGDRHQSIYAFRGADVNAIPNVIAALSADVLPLSICYRCPSNVIREAQAIVPAIEAAPDAPEGIVRTETLAACERDVQPGDYVVSRTNAPLVSLCFRLLAQGRRACIRGRDIGAGLAAQIRATKSPDVETLLTRIDAWRAAECKRREAKDLSTTDVIDRAECIAALASQCATPDALAQRIEGLFSDVDARGAVVLTSTHRAKGLEADRVWLLRDTYCRWPGVEEANLLYVAITRAKRELVYVRETEKP